MRSDSPGTARRKRKRALRRHLVFQTGCRPDAGSCWLENPDLARKQKKDTRINGFDLRSGRSWEPELRSATVRSGEHHRRRKDAQGQPKHAPTTGRGGGGGEDSLNAWHDSSKDVMASAKSLESEPRGAQKRGSYRLFLKRGH